MPEIRVLDKQTINQIAAGEVVERPASVVKELVENAIDAGAGAVTCEITGGGIDMIRITDNGCGIDADQVKIAFLRHSTSKIRSAEDLETVTSLGFRGEALASIASVADVELVTKTRTAFTGTRYHIADGEELEFEEVGAPDGTTFIVRNLFKNVPARRKFLKSASTEAGHIAELVERIAVSHPEVSIKLIINGRNTIFTSGNRRLKDIIYGIYGRDITASLIELEYEEKGIAVQGFIAKPNVARSNRSLENYYVNGRYIKSPIISKAIEDGYKNFMMQHKYPFTALMLSIEPSTMDVNVHPTKQEVRFEKGDDVYEAVYHAIREALTEKNLVRAAEGPGSGSVSVNREITEVNEAGESNWMKDKGLTWKKEEAEVKVQEAPLVTEENETEVSDAKISEHAFYKDNNQVIEAGAEKRSTAAYADKNTASPSAASEELSPENNFGVKPHKAKPERLPEVFESNRTEKTGNQFAFDIENTYRDINSRIREESRDDFRKSVKADLRIIGQLFDTFWLCQKGSEFLMIDQHAAHEKILYERLCKKIEAGSLNSQMVSPPILITLTASEGALVEQHMEELNKYGFEVSAFGGHEYAISAVPTELYGMNGVDFFKDLICELGNNAVRTKGIIFNNKLATIACKAAVKGNTPMSMEEAKVLIDELMTIDNPFNCPHGRPAIISMTKTDVEKKFKRIV